MPLPLVRCKEVFSWERILLQDPWEPHWVFLFPANETECPGSHISLCSQQHLGCGQGLLGRTPSLPSSLPRVGVFISGFCHAWGKEILQVPG